MAKIDDLLAYVTDTGLRDQLGSALSEIRDCLQFGLVFEPHIPETVSLPKLRIKKGALVTRRDKSWTDEWVVKSISGDQARLTHPRTKEEREEALAKLAVVKPFGEPIYPALVPLESIRRHESRPWHSVINGENYHALQVLLYLFEQKVDCIYIDPPYNTGNRDWSYNNRFIDSNDAYRHSKWLSFMDKRLRVAKRLLAPEGVLVVTADEHEVLHLGMLLERIFPEFVRQMVTIVINPKGVTQAGFSRVEEYAFFCFAGVARTDGRGDDLLTPEISDEDVSTETTDLRPRWKGLLRSGAEARRKDRKDMFYPVLINSTRRAVVGVGEPLPFEQEPKFGQKIDGLDVAWPIRKDLSLGRWAVGHKTLRALVAKGYVAVGEFDKKRKTWGITYLSKAPQEQIAAGVLEVRSYDKTRNLVDVVYTKESARRIKTVWHRTRHDAGAGGSDLLTSFLGERAFQFPKSVYAVQDTLAAIVRSKPNALVIDFFAGSGTTLNAVCLLNEADGGSRRCILVTNNEVEAAIVPRLLKEGLAPGDSDYEAEGVFERVTRPRCKAMVTGTRADGSLVPGEYLDGRPLAKGFEENIEFYRLDYLDPNDVNLGRQFEAILPLLWLAAGGQGRRPTSKAKVRWVLPTACPFAVLVEPDSFAAFAKAVDSREDLSHVWLVTDDEQSFARMRSLLRPRLRVAMLYRQYLRNFVINAERHV